MIAPMTTLRILCAFSLLLLPVFAQKAPSIHRLDGTVISSSEAESIAADELKRDGVTGAQIAILNQGRVVWMHGFGLRDVERQLPMTTDTNLWAASITKGVFGAWVMRLVEEHRLDLDQPIATMLPRPLDEYDAYRATASDLVRDPRWQKVTPRMMLTHSSGLANFAALEPDKKLHLHFAPGSKFAYSGDGLNLLQFAIEQKLNEPLDVAMQRDLFGPLGMSRTGMVWRAEFDENGALRYGAKGQRIGVTHRDRPRAAGSMTTSVHDLSLFLEALFRGRRVLGSKAMAEMFSPQIVIHSARQFPTLDPATGNDGEKNGLSYGLGWGLLTRTQYGPAFFKEGHGDGAENYLICFVRSQSCMILLTNSDNGELAFRPLLERLIGDTVTPWEWESYTRAAILGNEEHSPTR